MFFQNGATGDRRPDAQGRIGALRSKLGSHNQNGTTWLLRCSWTLHGGQWRVSRLTGGLLTGVEDRATESSQAPQCPPPPPSPKQGSPGGGWLAIAGSTRNRRCGHAVCGEKARQTPFCTITNASKEKGKRRMVKEPSGSQSSRRASPFWIRAACS